MERRKETKERIEGKERRTETKEGYEGKERRKGNEQRNGKKES